MVATEAYELGVDNRNISKVERIGCPRNLGVYISPRGRQSRKKTWIDYRRKAVL